MATEPGSDTTIPVVEETARVGKRKVERERVQIRKTVAYRDEVVDVSVEEETLSIERVPVGQVVAEAPASREENGTLIVPVVEERVVVTKQLVVVEEVHVHRVRKHQSRQETVTLRRENVDISQKEDE